MQGKLIKGIGGFYYVHDGIGRVYECKARGILRNRDLKPLVGDDVCYEITDEEKGRGSLEDVLPRRNSLIRPAVANVDQALIVVSAQNPPFHPGLLDHFLLWMEWQRVPTVVGIGKTDLDADGRGGRIEEVYRGAGYEVCAFSAKTGEGLDRLRALLKGKITVFAGASGVGKSTLLNRLIPGAGMETGTLSRKLDRGKHTTRHSEFFFLEPGAYLLDTPGFTSLAAPEMEADEVKAYFPEFTEPSAACRFPDCAHLKEQDCGVRRALQAGRIAESRYVSYTQITEEIRGRRKY